jgi:hypothetical protein
VDLRIGSAAREALRGLPQAASPRQLRFLFLYPTPTFIGTHVRDSSSFVLAFSCLLPFRLVSCFHGLPGVLRVFGTYVVLSIFISFHLALARGRCTKRAAYSDIADQCSRRHRDAFAADEACRDVALHGRRVGIDIDMELLHLAHS